VPGVVWRQHRTKIIKTQLRIAWDALRAWRGEAARARLRGQLAGIFGVWRWLKRRKQIQATQKVSHSYLLSLLEKTK